MYKINIMTLVIKYFIKLLIFLYFITVEYFLLVEKHAIEKEVIND